MPSSFLPVHVLLTFKQHLFAPLYSDQAQQGKSVWAPGQWKSTYYASVLDTASVPSRKMPHAAGIHMVVFNNGTEDITHKTLGLGFLPGRHTRQLWNPGILNWSNFKMISRKETPVRRYHGYPVNPILWHCDYSKNLHLLRHGNKYGHIWPYMCACTCMCIQKLIHVYMWMCPKYETFLHFIRPTAAGTCCGNNLHATKDSIHLFLMDPCPEATFAWTDFCFVCVPCKEGSPDPCRGWTEMLDSKKAQACCQTLWPSEQLLWKSSVSQAPLCSPQPPIASASHDYSLARTESAWRDSVCLSEGNLT